MNDILWFNILTCPECLTEDEWYGYNKRTAWEKKAETNDEIDGTFRSYLKKASIYPEFSRVVAVSFKNWERKTVLTGEEWEKGLLKKVNDVFNNLSLMEKNRLWGFNIYWFDIPFLWKRMVINWIQPTKSLCISGLKPRDLDNYMVDVMLLWRQTSFTCSLDLLSLSLLGEKPNTDWIGEFVGSAVGSDNWDWVKFYTEIGVEFAEKCYDAIMYPEQRNEEVVDDEKKSAKEIAEEKMKNDEVADDEYVGLPF